MKLGELRPGDLVLLNDEGVVREGTVVELSTADHQVCVNNGIQDFWYDLPQVSGIPLSDEVLKKMGFEKLPSDGGVKYGKDSFRLVIPAEDDFSSVAVWYRDDKRQFNHPIMLHELQHIHYDATKMPLKD